MNVYLNSAGNRHGLMVLQLEPRIAERIMNLLVATGETEDAWHAQDIQAALQVWENFR